MNKPLPIPMPDWRSRWLVLPRWGVLHRVSSIKWGEDYPEQMINGQGTTVCGKTGFLMMPGFMSRMGLKRCPKCCKAMGIPQGDGCPENEGVIEQGDTPLVGAAGQSPLPGEGK